MDMVSVVITTHKRVPEMVERALKSVLSQTYKNLEVFVVDDSPADYPLRQAVETMVTGYSSQNVKYIPHEKCQGACVARNTGLRAAKGKYIAFLDDDDEWLPEKIEKQLLAFTTDRIALVYCGSNFNRDGVVTKRETEYVSGSIYHKLILGNFIGSTSFPLLRTQALRAVGGFDPLMQSAQDYDVWLRLAEKYEVAYVEEPLVTYYIHDGEQITRNYAKKVSGLERLNEKNMVYLKTDKNAMWLRTIKLAPMYAGNGQRWKAVCTWLRAVLLCPWKFKENLRYLVYMIRKVF